MYAQFGEPQVVRCAMVASTFLTMTRWRLSRSQDRGASWSSVAENIGLVMTDTTNYTAVAASVKLVGEIFFSNASQPLSDAATFAVAEGIAEFVGVPRRMVNLTVNMTTSQRRLGINGRQLLLPAALRIQATYIIRLPADSAMRQAAGAAAPGSVEAALVQASSNLSTQAYLTQLISRAVSLADPSVTISMVLISQPSRLSVPGVITRAARAATYNNTNHTITTRTQTHVQTGGDSGEDDEFVYWPWLLLIMLLCCCCWCCCCDCWPCPQIRRWRAARSALFSVIPDSKVVPSLVPPRTRPRQETDEMHMGKAISAAAVGSLPGYWSNSLGLRPERPDSLSFDQMVYVAQKNLAKFQGLMDITYRPIATQDRPCPRGTCGKVRGGCPCVQPGGSPGLPSGYKVKRVIRVEDSGMFERYVQRRNATKSSRVVAEALHPPLFTQESTGHRFTDVLAPLDASLNEAYLWHGTTVRVGLAIAQEDFSLRFSGSGAGSMYGQGLYFAESCTKADEYAPDEPGGHYEGTHALLLCRACLGKFYYVTDRDSGAKQKVESGEFDSTVGDRSAAVNTYREIVLYDPDQVYPEYLILYDRLDGGKTVEANDTPFHLQLPVYWVNVHRNPIVDSFSVHYTVREKVKELIQRLASGTCSGSKPVVQDVRRVEDSELWNRYVAFKAGLHQRLRSTGETRCLAPNELDGKPDSGHALTSKLLEDELDAEEAVSTENMDFALNELLLWHGTDADSATAIAESGFLIGGAGNAVKHGRRFGEGAYFAEDLAKSIAYAPASSAGVRYILLCRTVCGHIWYTEKSSDTNAQKAATKIPKAFSPCQPRQKRSSRVHPFRGCPGLSGVHCAACSLIKI
ncbi:unnamed protein product [Polarella glacialis]|nr:unnamed protein product [Polarella glacialis]